MNKETFLIQAKTLIQQFESYVPVGDEVLDSRQIIYAIRTVKQMIHWVLNDAVPPRRMRHMVLTRMALDEWPIGHPFSRGVNKIEEAFLGLP